MKNKDHFVSGEEYCLKEIFGETWKIVIPDLQRDYCWGNETYDKNKRSQGELVTQFVRGLLYGFGHDSTVSMSLGLLYGYEAPKGQIQLCDGQQRLTTLYLLMGVLYRLTNNSELEHLLMTQFEKEDDQETQLQYAIRESTLYFLSDLVYEYFIKKNETFDSLKKATWYYAEYDLDGSIQSILGAIDGMERLLQECVDVNLLAFSNFVINNLRFVYYDMGDRLHGEETFVVINTTGEPLSATENLKPILIGGIKNEAVRQKYSDEWEEREEWFWKHRDEEKHEMTSDALSRDFYVWYWQLQLLQERMWKKGKAFDINPKELFLKRPDKSEDAEENDSTDRWNGALDNVHKRFEALKLLAETINVNEKFREILAFRQKYARRNDISIFDWLREKSNLDLLLPLISFCEKYAEEPSFQDDIVTFGRRLCKNSFDKEYKRTRKNEDEAYLDWRYVVQIVEQTNGIDELLTFNSLRDGAFAKTINNVRPTCWYDFDEQMKQKYQKEGLDVSALEMNDSLRFDLSVLWGEDGNYAVGEIRKRFENLVALHDCLSDNHVISYDLANFYRLYRLVKGWGSKVGHVSYYTWTAEGIIFGRHDYEASYREEYKDAEFLNLLSESDLSEALKRLVANVYEDKDIDLSADIEPAQYLKIWMLLKVLVVNKEKQKLGYWNDRAIGCNRDMEKNKLNTNCTFSLANSWVGYIWRGGVVKVHKDRYLNPALLDTPLYVPMLSVDYSDFEQGQVPENDLKILDEYLHQIYKGFLTYYK